MANLTVSDQVWCRLRFRKSDGKAVGELHEGQLIWNKRWGMDDASTDARSGNGPKKGCVWLCDLGSLLRH